MSERTKLTARKSTGGRAPHFTLATSHAARAPSHAARAIDEAESSTASNSVSVLSSPEDTHDRSPVEEVMSGNLFSSLIAECGYECDDRICLEFRYECF